MVQIIILHLEKKMALSLLPYFLRNSQKTPQKIRKFHFSAKIFDIFEKISLTLTPMVGIIPLNEYKHNPKVSGHWRH